MSGETLEEQFARIAAEAQAAVQSAPLTTDQLSQQLGSLLSPQQQVPPTPSPARQLANELAAAAASQHGGNASSASSHIVDSIDESLIKDLNETYALPSFLTYLTSASKLRFVGQLVKDQSAHVGGPDVDRISGALYGETAEERIIFAEGSYYFSLETLFYYRTLLILTTVIYRVLLTSFRWSLVSLQFYPLMDVDFTTCMVLRIAQLGFPLFFSNKLPSVGLIRQVLFGIAVQSYAFWLLDYSSELRDVLFSHVPLGIWIALDLTIFFGSSGIRTSTFWDIVGLNVNLLSVAFKSYLLSHKFYNSWVYYRRFLPKARELTFFGEDISLEVFLRWFTSPTSTTASSNTVTNTKTVTEVLKVPRLITTVVTEVQQIGPGALTTTLAGSLWYSTITKFFMRGAAESAAPIDTVGVAARTTVAETGERKRVAFVNRPR